MRSLPSRPVAAVLLAAAAALAVLPHAAAAAGETGGGPPCSGTVRMYAQRGCRGDAVNVVSFPGPGCVSLNDFVSGSSEDTVMLSAKVDGKRCGGTGAGGGDDGVAPPEEEKGQQQDEKTSSPRRCYFKFSPDACETTPIDQPGARRRSGGGSGAGEVRGVFDPRDGDVGCVSFGARDGGAAPPATFVVATDGTLVGYPRADWPGPESGDDENLFDD